MLLAAVLLLLTAILFMVLIRQSVPQGVVAKGSPHIRNFIYRDRRVWQKIAKCLRTPTYRVGM